MKKPRVSLDRVLEAVEADEYIGFCIACGYEQEGVEPDARKYKCEECNRAQVYGAEEVLIMI